LPTLIKDAGLPISAAANITAMFQIGGTFGAVIIGWAMDRVRPSLIISAAYFAGALCVLGLSEPARSRGAGTVGRRRGVLHERSTDRPERLRANLLSNRRRATGVSWMLGMGRFGSILAQ